MTPPRSAVGDLVATTTGAHVDWSAPSSLDREAAHRCDRDWLARCWADPRSVVLAVAPDGRLAADASGSPLLEAPGAAEGPGAAEESEAPEATVVLVGRVRADGRWIWARALSARPTCSVGLRDLPGGLDPAVAEACVVAVALVRWHLDARHAPRTGVALRPGRAGAVRVPGESAEPLPSDEAVGGGATGRGGEEFPRTDPAVIMAVVDEEDRLLLARQPSWPARRLSVLAGFVEAGESLEQAVHREVAEEAGVSLGALAYVASQPWPQPRSLMVGFVARATTTALDLGDDELEWAGWYTRAEATRQVRAGELLLPGSASLGHHLVSGWLTGTLPAV